MRNLVDRTRLAALGIIGAILLAASAAVVAVEPRLILGQANDARLANTGLLTASVGEALSVIQNGNNGVAVRGAATRAGGVGGSFLGISGTGVDGRTRAPERFGIYATNEAATTGTGAAIRADGRANAAIVASSAGAAAIVADGATVLDGSLSVTGGCIGCATMVVGRNISDVGLRQGDALALEGVDAAADGSTLLLVRPALPGERVIGIADRLVTLDARPAGGAEIQGVWRVGGTEIETGAMTRVVTDGMLTLDRSLGATTGDQLMVGAQPGRLVAAGPGGRAGIGVVVGTYLGDRHDGMGVVLVDID